MRDLAILFIHLLATIAKMTHTGGARALVAESLLLKHQLMVLNRGCERAANLRPMDRDLESKLLGFKDFYNDQRCHYALGGGTPIERTGKIRPKIAAQDSYR